MSAHEVINLDYVQALHRRNVIRVPIDEITHMHADSKYVSVYHDGCEILLRTPLSKIDEVLRTRFVRVHRNTLVNRKHILRFTPPSRKTRDPGYVYVAGLAAPLKISRRQLPDVRTAADQATNSQSRCGEAVNEVLK
jgi:two-component system response regulator AlgR